MQRWQKTPPMRLKRAQRDQIAAKIEVCPTSPEYRQVNQARAHELRLKPRLTIGTKPSRLDWSAPTWRGNWRRPCESFLSRWLSSCASSAFAGASPAEAQGIAGASRDGRRAIPETAITRRGRSASPQLPGATPDVESIRAQHTAANARLDEPQRRTYK